MTLHDVFISYVSNLFTSLLLSIKYKIITLYKIVHYCWLRSYLLLAARLKHFFIIQWSTSSLMSTFFLSNIEFLKKPGIWKSPRFSPGFFKKPGLFRAFSNFWAFYEPCRQWERIGKRWVPGKRIRNRSIWFFNRCRVTGFKILEGFIYFYIFLDTRSLQSLQLHFSLSLLVISISILNVFGLSIVLYILVF